MSFHAPTRLSASRERTSAPRGHSVSKKIAHFYNACRTHAVAHFSRGRTRGHVHTSRLKTSKFISVLSKKGYCFWAATFRLRRRSRRSEEPNQRGALAGLIAATTSVRLLTVPKSFAPAKCNTARAPSRLPSYLG